MVQVWESLLSEIYGSDDHLVSLFLAVCTFANVSHVAETFGLQIFERKCFRFLSLIKQLISFASFSTSSASNCTHAINKY
ncbi:hypothetical protein OIU74_021678 [Salix koriyanagi]|uniref:Uncharacterized protein n=1 Tax=Salix koriyanagi TaxID=2511006 RepID=A0A9Q0WL19_9ROSI|nr:hypothetical protein OIU74_021678 [Salix koriyanagi]